LPIDDRLEHARAVYEAFASGNRDFIEASFTADLSFSSPLDVGLDRAGYFDRCWPGAGQGQKFEFLRLIRIGDDVLVTYEMTGADGRKGRNTEILTFRGNQICRVEVYFGWDV